MTRARLILATAALGVLTLTACSDDGSATDAGADPTAIASASAPVTPSTQPSDDVDPSVAPSSSNPTSGAAVPLYFLGDTPQGPRLFREFQQVAQGNPVDEALAALVSGDALDPDYSTSAFPPGTPTQLSQDETVEIELPDASWTTRPAGMTARQAKLAVQQIVYTVQGIQQRRITVGFTMGGNSVDFLGLDSAGGFSAAKQNNVLALVNITTPEQGATVSGSFTATGLSNSFEASGPWELRADDGTVVKSGAYQALGWIDKLYSSTAEVDLSGVPPGHYTFAVLTDDPSAGTEGPGPTEDTKAITVQ